ncbi:fructosamine kinase family protein [Planosporangium mesophilum]|uniref:Fructosamine kinase n=1 Tax=Planosporangium mesophilum TaxID=689768 RepID=A0A8J3WZG9_9ACTN|nr:fructosamine kinase family protein [Planosporangium mesophilum]NJC82274.1 phosphotransferase [Planosporangium mesophilum]GII22325.1 fructosamine kinase [Planosporangium mesophilum]
MDLAYLREHPHHLPTFLTHQRIRETPVAGGSICASSRLTFDTGESVFAKSLEGAPSDFFAAEANGLRWLREAGAVPVPEVIAELPGMLALEWVEQTEPEQEAAERLGRELAALHRAGAPAFGADWPGYIGSLPLANEPSPGPWPGWFAANRLAPYLRMSVDNGSLSNADAARIDQIIENIDGCAGEAGDEPPARIHGDLWPGNLLWSGSRVWLVDPAAHGGHRETDLALLSLFGSAPYSDRILHAYDEAWPLAAGWRERVPLHQLYLLLVHTALFGGAYRSSVLAAARAVGF